MSFNPTQFKLDYPQFADMSDSYLTNVYTFEAVPLGMQVINLFKTDEYKTYWGEVVLAHILTLLATGQSGRISSASDGDVFGDLDYQSTLSSQWWNMTVYGQKCWQIMNVKGGFAYFAASSTVW